MIALAFCDPPLSATAGSTILLTVSVANMGPIELSGLSTAPAKLSYRWEGSDEEPRRSDFWCPCKPGEHRMYRIAVDVPLVLGQRELTPAIVLEGLQWLDDAYATPITINISVDAETPTSQIAPFEVKEYSQNGEDGVMREIVLRIGTSQRRIVEIGAGAGGENNSALWLERYGWSGLLIEGDVRNAQMLERRYNGRRDISIVPRYVDVASLVEEFRKHCVQKDFDILSIDTDGNDYWLWEAAAAWRPRIVVIEYNASRGPRDDWVMPYDPHHRWDGGGYFGASLSALERLGTALGYGLIGCERTGVNAFFIREDLLALSGFRRTSADEAYRKLTSSSSGNTGRTGSSSLREHYTEEYFVRNCGGFQFFDNDDPLRIDDPRLRAAVMPAELRTPARALDIGCGRGELTGYLLARQWTVDATDYSDAAITLTRAYLDRCGLADSNVSLCNADVNAIALTDSFYDLAFAVDVVEHLSPPEVASLFDKVRRALTTDGWFVVHTFPNAWYYNFGWPRLRAAAGSRGETLPEDPRTEYERLMHINEQSPKALARALARHFPYFTVWLGSSIQPFAVDLRVARREDLRGFPDLFAIASHSPFADPTASPIFSVLPITTAEQGHISISKADPVRALDRQHFRVRIALTNGTSRALSSFGPAPIFVSYQLIGGDGALLQEEGRRTPILPPICQGERANIDVLIDAVDERAQSARVTLVQEGIAWFREDRALIVELPHRSQYTADVATLRPV